MVRPGLPWSNAKPAGLTHAPLPCACRVVAAERVKQELAQAQAKRRAASGASSTPAREKAASEEPGSGADKKQGALCGRGWARLLAHRPRRGTPGLSSSAPFPAGAAAKRAKSSKPELNLVLPEAIEVQLVDDWEAITRDQRVREMPPFSHARSWWAPAPRQRSAAGVPVEAHAAAGGGAQEAVGGRDPGRV